MLTPPTPRRIEYANSPSDPKLPGEDSLSPESRFLADSGSFAGASGSSAGAASSSHDPHNTDDHSHHSTHNTHNNTHHNTHHNTHGTPQKGTEPDPSTNPAGEGQPLVNSGYETGFLASHGKPPKSRNKWLTGFVEILVILQAIAAFVYLLVFRLQHQSRYRATFVCILISFIVLVNHFIPPPYSRWAAVHIVLANIVFAINTICSLIVLCILWTVTGESGDLLAWNLVALEITLCLWFEWPLSLYPCLRKRCCASKSQETNFTGAPPSSPCSLGCCCKTAVGAVFIVIVELLLLALFFTSYGAISRTYFFVNYYLVDRTYVTFDGVQTSLSASCFVNGNRQPLSDVKNLGGEVFVLEMGLALPVEAYTSFLRDLSYNAPNSVACSVSRPGNGWSDALTLDQLEKPLLPSDTSRALANWLDIHSLRNVTLIGHEYGGLQIAQLYKFNPTLVQRLIFVDSLNISRRLYPSVEYAFPLPPNVIQAYGLEGILAFFSLFLLPDFFRNSNSDFQYIGDSLYSAAAQLFHTQMFETAMKDAEHLPAAMNQSLALCDTPPPRAPIQWITSARANADQQPYVCLFNWGMPFKRTGLNISSSLRIFSDQRGLLLQAILGTKN